MNLASENRQCVIAGCDDAYVQHYAVMVSSFVRFNPSRAFVFYLLTTGLSHESLSKLEEFKRAVDVDLRIIDISDMGETLAGLSVTQHVSAATYYRLLIPELIPPEVERALYLDVDLLVRGDVSQLFAVDLKDVGVAAVPDPLGDRFYRNHGLESAEKYFNSGVMMLNLAYWRTHSVGVKALEYARAYPERLECWDQCALNAVLKDSVLYLESKWNRHERTVPLDGSSSHLREIVILHFTGSIKPWLYISDQMGKADYWCFLRGTPWRGYVPPDRTLLNRLKRTVPAAARWRVRAGLLRLKEAVMRRFG
jgi:lipopolysaccharide biosynthesis glycosyltransferase